MNTMDAAFAVAHDYDGGAKALGERMGLRDLSDRVNPALAHRLLGLGQAVRMQLLAKDYRVLYAMALELRHYPPVPMPDDADGCQPCLQKMGEVCREVGALMEEVSRDLSDDKVTDNELAAATRQAGKLVAAVQGLMGQLAAMNAVLKAQQSPLGAS
jgi:hypothetical protein